MNENKKNVRLNIYLTTEDKKKLNEIKFKYQLSYSTIARLLGEAMASHIENSKQILNGKYIYANDTGQKKTSIKPRHDVWNNYFIETPTVFYTNAIKIYTRNEEKKYMEVKEFSKYQKELEKAFKEEKDPNWNGNEWQRRMPRLIKQNREYYKKLLEGE